MDGPSPVPLSLADALVGLQMQDPRTPKKISLNGSEEGKLREPDGSPESVATTAGVAGEEDARGTPQKVELAAEATEFTPCGPPPGLQELSAALGSPAPLGGAAEGTPSGGVLGTSPLADLAACGLPGYFEACGMDSSIFGTPSSGPAPCSPYALFGPEFFPEMVSPTVGEVEFMSLFQGLMHDAPVTSASAKTTDTFQMLAAMAEETADPILAALAASSPLKKKTHQPEGDPAAGKLDAPPGLPLPSRQKPGSEAPPGLAGWASDDSTASPASDGTDAPSTSSRSDLPQGSPASDSFTMSPEAAPFVPSFAGLVTAPLDPLAVLATAPPAHVPAVPILGGEEEEDEAKHGAGNCRPCAWFWKEVGCASGKDCEYCHECPKGALKARKKVKRALIRLGQATSPGAQEAFAPAPASPNFVLSLSALL